MTAETSSCNKRKHPKKPQKRAKREGQHTTQVFPQKKKSTMSRFKVVLLVKPPITYTPLKNSQFP